MNLVAPGVVLAGALVAIVAASRETVEQAGEQLDQAADDARETVEGR